MYQRRTSPRSGLQMDYIDALSVTKEGYKYLLAVADAFSGGAEAFPIKAHTAGATANVVFKGVFSRPGTRAITDSDRGPYFVGETTKALTQALGIQQKRRVSYRPPARWRQRAEALRKVVCASGKKWTEKSPLLLAAVRSATRLRPRLTPYHIIFDRPMELRINPLQLRPDEIQETGVISWIK